MKHFLLTRFNIVNEYDDRNKLPKIEWLENRFNIFSAVTLPSIAAQTSQPNIWLILLDIETPESIRAKLDSAINDYGIEFCKLCYIPFFNLNVVRKLVELELSEKDEWLITTRLDNDDALHPNYLNVVKSSVQYGVREFINITQGLILANGKGYRKNDYSNPFISLSEPSSDFKTVWVEQHHRVSRFAPIKQIKLHDGWIQFVHGGNVANQIRGVYASYTSINKENLPKYLASTLNVGSISDMLFEHTYGLLIRYAKSFFRRIRTELKDYLN